ncbi:T9SS type A sorting domain-containing protein [Marinigracilibium pacificum]|uniref:T9SS type A sorting domain-containing protein n=1 Tax=Marinigracilibium pacificum TaxID=2729599 RepID=A0A848J0B6_9BACT|nr:T9SS type A sorting domain-containing protein [Marinigracilibium pacificum]NMM48965.1 T9SS type A sorting domain-containing protein [Marinigracilibium pacificum]
MINFLTKKVVIASLLTFILIFNSNAQQVNAFAEVTAISGTTLSLTNVDETFDTFEVGEKILIMQMQDDIIGETSNTATFGDMNNIRSAGLLEMVDIISVNESGGSPVSIEVDMISNNFNICNNCAVQVVSFPDLGTNYSTTADVTSKAWDGSTGGVVALRVSGVLTLNHDINLDGKGFRGGATDDNFSASACDETMYYTSSTSEYASKGEGIYKVTDASYLNGRGKILNGGGGGNTHNGGGGGGGNLNSGGDGGAGWSCNGTNGGGIGGLGLETYISSSRMFMGGGGGAGEGNNYVNTDGGNGGGIIIVQAQTLKTVGNDYMNISANGETAADAGNDGAGGGGAAGSILMDVLTYNILGASGVNIRANGGNGGNVNNSSAHGGGGGGSQGVIMFSAAHPAEVVSETIVGLAGCDNTSCSSTGLNAGGADLDGIFVGAGSPLPVELIYFEAIPLQSEQAVKLKWGTAVEIDNEKFIIERSADGINWTSIQTIQGNGNSNSIIHYSTIDDDPIIGKSYYRLRQVDYNGDMEYSEIVAVEFYTNHSFLVYPNPTTDNLYIKFDSRTEIGRISMVTTSGALIEPNTNYTPGVITINTHSIARGMYSLIIETNKETITRKIVVR